MYKKISNNEKITKKISAVHSADNYLTQVQEFSAKKQFIECFLKFLKIQ